MRKPTTLFEKIQMILAILTLLVTIAGVVVAIRGIYIHAMSMMQ